MRGEDRQEERDELKNQLMLFQLLPRNKKEGKKTRWGKGIKKEPKNNVDKLEETPNAKEDFREEEEKERSKDRNSKKDEMKSMFSCISSLGRLPEMY